MHIVECVRVGFSIPDEPKFYGPPPIKGNVVGGRDGTGDAVRWFGAEAFETRVIPTKAKPQVGIRSPRRRRSLPPGGRWHEKWFFGTIFHDG